MTPPQVRPPLTRAEVVPSVVRNLIPLAGLWLSRGSFENFLLLCVFNEAFAIAGLAVVGIAVSTRETRLTSGPADNIAAWALLVLVGIVTTLGLTAMFGWAVALMASAQPLGLWNAELGWSLLAIIAASTFGMHRQYQRDVASKLDEPVRRRRDQPAIGGHLLSALGVMLLGGYSSGGLAGVIVVALALTALFVFRDLRPD
ncbi:MAG: hypothetical protein ACREO3_08935, partial [Arenimonas sp.]